MRNFTVLLLPAFFCTLSVMAQKQERFLRKTGDTITALAPFKPKAEQPREKIYHPDSSHHPRKALFESLILPGLGQVYNRKYWKLPIIYGGFAGLAYSYWFAQTNYKFYLHQTTLSPTLVLLNSDYYRRNRDLTVILSAAFWVVQSIDAYIDAKFQHSFSIDDNLAFKIKPAIISGPAFASASFIPAIKLTAGIK